jgi:hypothetical protein
LEEEKKKSLLNLPLRLERDQLIGQINSFSGPSPDASIFSTEESAFRQGLGGRRVLRAPISGAGFINNHQ